MTRIFGDPQQPAVAFTRDHDPEAARKLAAQKLGTEDLERVELGAAGFGFRVREGAK